MPKSFESDSWELRNLSLPFGRPKDLPKQPELDRPMRILFVHNRYQNLGGEDLAARSESDLFLNRGHAVDLFEADNARIAGFKGKVNTAVGTMYSVSSRQSMTARIASFRPDVVQIHNFFPLLSPSVYYASRQAGVPTVQTLHNYRLICPSALLLREGRVCEDCVGKLVPWPGVVHACYRGSYAGSAVVAAMLAAHRALGTWKNVVDAYIARTNFSREKLIEGGLPAERIGIIPSFAPDPGGSGDGTGGFALFAGRLSPEKGIATLLSAWDLLKNSPLSLKIVGDGPLRDEVVRRTARGRIEYLGQMSRQDVQRLMDVAAFSVFPSVCYENFPLSIVEAFASGTPVIASGMGAMAEIVENGRTGLHFQPGDPDDLAAKIEWLISHPEEMVRMRREARAEYLSKYTPERNYQLMMQLYERTIHAGCRSSAE